MGGEWKEEVKGWNCSGRHLSAVEFGWRAICELVAHV